MGSEKTDDLVILISEPNADRHHLLKSYLQGSAVTASYTLLTQERGVAMLIALNQLCPQAVFIGEQMADMSALEWLRLYSNAEQSRAIPVFILLAEEDPAAIAALTAAGATFCFHLETLSAPVLQQILRYFLAAKSAPSLLPAATISPLEDRLQLAFETAKMGYWEWDISLNRMRWRYQPDKIFQLWEPHFDGTMESVLALIHPADRAIVEQSLAASIASGSAYTFEFRIQKQNGDVHWLAGDGRTFLDQAGNAILMIGVVRDVTERRQIEARLELLLTEAHEAKSSAEQANRAKDEFIAQVTHDLRAPLSAVLGWAKMLKNKNVPAAIQQEAIHTILDSAEKQKNLVEDLLDVSRMAMGQLRLEVQPVSLSAVIRSAMEVMRPAYEAKELVCATELATDADAVTGDAARLEQVIWNLVSNAVKFTDNGGQLKVRLERADPYVRITVQDTGRGIKPEHLPFVFERYWQPDAASGKRKGGGLGLGLSLVKYIVELHGGTVSVTSAGENKGARFTVNLPYRAVRVQPDAARLPTDVVAAERRAAAPFAAPAFTSNALQGLLVIVVDDEPSARDLVAEILRQHGATVTTADSAATAYRLLQNVAPTPDLLISDISMPEEDGYMLIRKIRRLPPAQGGAIPAVALTAFGRMEDRVRVLSAGFQMHLPKPVEPAELALVAAKLTNREMKPLL